MVSWRRKNILEYSFGSSCQQSWILVHVYFIIVLFHFWCSAYPTGQFQINISNRIYNLFFILSYCNRLIDNWVPRNVNSSTLSSSLSWNREICYLGIIQGWSYLGRTLFWRIWKWSASYFKSNLKFENWVWPNIWVILAIIKVRD